MDKLDYVISVVAPVHNQGNIIREIIPQLAKELDEKYENFEILLVDDASTDDTTAIIDTLLNDVKCVRYLRLGRHLGKEAAITTGLRSAIGDYVAVMSLKEDPIDAVPLLLDAAMNNKKGVVLGIQKNPRQKSLVLKTLTRLFHWYCKKTMGLILPENFEMFMVLNRKSVNSLTKGKTSECFSRIISLERAEMQYVAKEHGSDQNFTFIKKLQSAADTIESNSVYPLTLVTFLGLFASGINLMYTMYVLAVALMKKDVMHGWTTTSLQISIMFFLLFTFLTVLSNYVGKLFNELIGKEIDPIIFEKNSSVLLANAEEKNVLS